jgi:hypothetical protein
MIVCFYGAYKLVNVINSNQMNKCVKVDACIAEEIKVLNTNGIVTIGCCCSHGTAGHIFEILNSDGKWKEIELPPHAVIKEHSVDIAKQKGYKPYPYLRSMNDNSNDYIIHLKTGCVSISDCKEWHENHDIPCEKHLGVINT